MPISCIQLAAIKDELTETVMDSRIDKIEQPGRFVMVLTFRSKSNDTRKLLISVSSSDTRVHLTQFKLENPASPPMFCMLLRKHLSGAKVLDISQPENDRILELTLKTSTALGDATQKRLIIELFGRVPNIILIDDNNIIIDALRRISADISGGQNDISCKRMILPGLRYHLPTPAPERPELPVKTTEVNGSMSKMLDEKHTRKAKEDSILQKGSNLLKTMKTAQKRILRKIDAQKGELEETKERDYFRECGEIIKANIYRMKKGEELLIADDFYSENADKREIKLDNLKTPEQNAAKYFKAYVKARNAEKILTEQIEIGVKELEYIESVIELLSRVSSDKELEDVKTELTQTGYYKEKSKTKTKKIESLPNLFKSSSGLQIMTGKNNIQNEKLTFKLALKTDIWLHAQKIHGAHVIIKLDGKVLDDKTLCEAASIAAYYSAARGDSKVPVDYTSVKYIKKQPGSRPGMVIYTDYKTMLAVPDEEQILKLKQ